MSGVRGPVPAVGFVKGHAYGNDFLFIDADDATGLSLPAAARAICDRHRGIGGDGLVVYRRTLRGASMQLFNADGSRAEVSGNGLRCLAALLVESGKAAPDAGGAVQEIEIVTAVGAKTLTLLHAAPPRYTFRAAMGRPHGLREEQLTAGGERVRAVTLSVGNPHCVVLAASVDEAQRAFSRLGPILTTHERFPEGTNVEFVVVERPDRLRILIWERGVGPTSASGTGACAAAVAAARYGGAARSITVVSPGGAQQVEWSDEGVSLTGWADIVARGHWMRATPPA